jgi:hypothetical protein
MCRPVLIRRRQPPWPWRSFPHFKALDDLARVANADSVALLVTAEVEPPEAL